MKITVRQLREIIKEEVKRSIFENRAGEGFDPPPGTEQLYQEILELYEKNLLGFVEDVKADSRWIGHPNVFGLSAILDDYPSGSGNGDVCDKLAIALIKNTDLFKREVS